MTRFARLSSLVVTLGVNIKPGAQYKQTTCILARSVISLATTISRAQHLARVTYNINGGVYEAASASSRVAQGAIFNMYVATRSRSFAYLSYNDKRGKQIAVAYRQNTRHRANAAISLSLWYHRSTYRAITGDILTPHRLSTST